MIVAYKNEGDRVVTQCQKYPHAGAHQRAKLREAADVARREVANPILFMTMTQLLRVAPKTEVVAKGQQLHRFGFDFPVVVKPLDGRPLQQASTQAELERITKALKSVGYQVQQFLRGYTFLKVSVISGNLELDVPRYVSGTARRLINLLVAQGVLDFTLTVATNKETTYIVGARLN
jgi:hypothetical protein